MTAPGAGEHPTAGRRAAGPGLPGQLAARRLARPGSQLAAAAWSLAPRALPARLRALPAAHWAAGPDPVVPVPARLQRGDQALDDLPPFAGIGHGAVLLRFVFRIGGWSSRRRPAR